MSKMKRKFEQASGVEVNDKIEVTIFQILDAQEQLSLLVNEVLQLYRKLRDEQHVFIDDEDVCDLGKLPYESPELVVLENQPHDQAQEVLGKLVVKSGRLMQQFVNRSGRFEEHDLGVATPTAKRYFPEAPANGDVGG